MATVQSLAATPEGVGWVLCTGTGPGLTPDIAAGKGCRGRREFLPGDLAPYFVACTVRSYRQRHVRYTRVRTTTRNFTCHTNYVCTRVIATH